MAMRYKGIPLFTLCALLMLITGCSERETTNQVSENPQTETLNVKYETISQDWPSYASLEDLVNASDKIILGTVSEISFQVLDIRTGKPPADNAEKSNCYLYTIYDVDTIETYKGNSSDHEEIRIIGGIKDRMVGEQISLVENGQSIPLIEGMPSIVEGEMYLFMLYQYEDTIPTVVNLDQSIYNICEAFSTETEQNDKITFQDIVSYFDADEWENLYNKYGELDN